MTQDMFEAAMGQFAEVPRFMARYRAEMLNHPTAGWCLRNFLILTDFPELLAEYELSNAELHWSRYYWFARFTNVWTALVGYDAGLQQQLFQLAEHAPDHLSTLPKVEAAAYRDAAEQLRAANSE